MPRMDLDSFIKDQNQDPFVVTLDGKDFTVPFDVPAFAFQKYAGLDENNVTAETMGEIIALAFGDEQFKAMRKAGLTSGGMLETKVFVGTIEHMSKVISGESDLGKIIEMAQKTPSQTNGRKPKAPPKTKAKRSPSR